MPPSLIPLQQMPQQASAGPESDWTGVSDPRSRKKMQDRVHQRIRRYRKKEAARVDSFAVEEARRHPVFSLNPNQPATCTSLSKSTTQPYQPIDLNSFTACEPDSEQTEWFMRQFTARAHQDFVHNSPRVDMLLRLVQFNTTRALVMNARIMGITREIMAPESRSQLASGRINVAGYHSLPLSLKPTDLQLTKNHHPWIDILPLPEIRNNLLRYDERIYDKKELCRDLRGFQATTEGYGGMVVWKDPWNPEGWEVTRAFTNKWPWVVKDCPDLLRTTNYWRVRKGQSELKF